MIVIRGSWAVNYSNAGGYKARQPGETGDLLAEASMTLIERLIVRTGRWSEEQFLCALLAGYLGTIVVLATAAWLVMR